jgi:hypothetical protein
MPTDPSTTSMTAKPCHIKIGWASGESYCGTHGRAAGWPCAAGNDGYYQGYEQMLSGPFGDAPRDARAREDYGTPPPGWHHRGAPDRTGPNLVQQAALLIVFCLAVLVLVTGVRFLVSASDGAAACSTAILSQR